MFSVVCNKAGNLFHILSATYGRLFLPMIAFLQQLAQVKQRSPSSGSVLTSWCKYITHIQRAQVTEIFKGYLH